MCNIASASSATYGGAQAAPTVAYRFSLFVSDESNPRDRSNLVINAQITDSEHGKVVTFITAPNSVWGYTLQASSKIAGSSNNIRKAIAECAKGKETPGMTLRFLTNHNDAKKLFQSGSQ